MPPEEMSMRALAWPAGAFGLLIAIVPQYVLPVCSAPIETRAGGTVPMRCFWTARAELGVGALIVLVGILLLLARNRPAALPLHAVLIGLGVVGLLLPTGLIGVCANPTMPCHIGTLPALEVLSGLVIVTGLTGMALASRVGSQAAPWPTV